MFPADTFKMPEGIMARVVSRGTSQFINKAGCRKFLLGYAAENRHHKFGRVDPFVFDELNGVLRKRMREIADDLNGKTMRPVGGFVSPLLGGSGRLLINKIACQKFLSGLNKRQIKSEVYEDLNLRLRGAMRHIVARNPSLGRTIR